MGGDATGNEAAWLDAFLDTRLHHLGHAYDDSSDADVHDFPDKQLGKAIPYGIYDVSANTGWVTVGTDHDTSAFRRRDPTQLVGHARTLRYPAADRLLICADGGGSNDTRVCAPGRSNSPPSRRHRPARDRLHLPPGTSKWNKSA